MRNVHKVIVLIFSFLFLINIYGENLNKKNGIAVSGFVIDSETKHPVFYANVLLFSNDTKKQVNGIATNEEGFFTLEDNPPGTYYIEVHFIGYDTKIINDIKLGQGDASFVTGDIIIKPDVMSTDIIDVEAERSPITYQIDKKVINVSEQLTASSGTAVDVLENVPSITVDIDGNVSLRGSSNFTVLIDGRSTIMDANDALQQIPAASIENIEIITNPSAKFNPEGAAGIINLVMKKNKKEGFNGLVEGNSGYRNRYGGQFVVNYKTDIYQLTMDVGYNKRTQYGNGVERNITTLQGISSFRNSNGSNDREGDRSRIRSELGIQLSSADFLTFGASLQNRNRFQNAKLAFLEWSDIDPTMINQTSNTARKRGGDEYELFFNYNHKFNDDGHLIKTEVQYESGDNKESTLMELLDTNGFIENGTKTTESGPDRELQFKINYTLPFNEDTKFEAGYQGELNTSDDMTGYYEYNPASDHYDFLEAFSNRIKFQHDEHALYSMYGSKIGDLGFQAGFRAEYTNRRIELIGGSRTFVFDRWDYFPSIHSSYEFNKNHQIMASYTRRIDRPHSWHLEPFQTWLDAYNLREGNPSLKPEYIDSFEGGYQAILGNIIFSTEFYHRINHNRIEDLRSVYTDNITLHTIENVGTDYSSGTELMMNFDPFSMWNVNLMGNLYYYRIKGVIFNEAFSRESFNWNLRFNNRVKLWEAAQLQLNMNYNSASVSSQSERKGFFYTQLALRQDFFNKSLTATLQIRDLFGTVNYKNISKGADFYSYRSYNREFPEITLNLRYFINPPKDRKDRNRNGQDSGDNDTGDEF